MAMGPKAEVASSGTKEPQQKVGRCGKRHAECGRQKAAGSGQKKLFGRSLKVISVVFALSISLSVLMRLSLSC